MLIHYIKIKNYCNTCREIALRLIGFDVYWNGPCAMVEQMDAKLKNDKKNIEVQPGSSLAEASMASIRQVQNQSIYKICSNYQLYHFHYVLNYNLMKDKNQF